MQDQDWDPILDGNGWGSLENSAAFQIPTLCGTDITQQVQAMLQASFPVGSEDFVYPLETTEADLLGHGHQRTEHQSSPSLHPTRYTSLSLTVSSLLLDSSAQPTEEETLLHTLAEQGFPIPVPCTLVVLAVFTDSPDLPAAACTIDQVLQRYGSCCSILSGGRVLSFFAAEPGFSQRDAVLENLLQVLRHRFEPDCILGVSRSFDRLSHCPLARMEAIDALRFSHGTGIRRYEDLLASSSAGHHTAGDVEADLKRLLSGPSREALEQYLSAFLHGNPEDMALLQLLAAAQRILTGSLGTPETALLFQRCGLDHLLQMDREHLIWRIRTLCCTAYDLLSRENQGGVAQLCLQAIRIIQQRYSEEDLSLLSVSQELHVSPNYLSSNMKKYAGDTFINLLVKQRMEAALALLKDHNISIGEIARRCGYRDQHYFSFCFKKYYGISPLKVRQSGGMPGEQHPAEAQS